MIVCSITIGRISGYLRQRIENYLRIRAKAAIYTLVILVYLAAQVLQLLAIGALLSTLFSHLDLCLL